MRNVGYLNNTGAGLEGEPGLFYDYILAGNGLFIRATSPLLQATVQIAESRVRGLPPLEGKVVLPKGRIPRYLFDLALSAFFLDRTQEYYLAVTWEDGYLLKEPRQDATSCEVNYEILPAAIMDIHSHGGMKAFFSPTDNSDEQGLRLYMVVGRLDTMIPDLKLRIGVYGYFSPIKFEDVFGV